MPDKPRTSDPADRETRLQAVLVQVLEAEEAGAHLVPITWYARHPEFQSELEEFFADQATLTHFRPIGSTAIPEFPGYEVIRELGRGGMGVVYEARQLDPPRTVALKALPTARLRTPVERVRFRREAQVAARLDHSGIVPVYDIGEADGIPFYTMRLATGGALSAVLGRYQADPPAAARLVAGLARAVHHAHQRGVLHRDLKPSNILLDADGCGMVGDFGLVRDLAEPEPLTRTTELIGTPAYMAPEQTQSKAGPITVAADIYGLGAVLYACLTCRPPFAGPNPADVLLKVRDTNPDPPGRSNPRVPRDLSAIVQKCLEKDPAARYASADDLADDLERFLCGKPVRAKPIGAVRRALRWAVRHPVQSVFTAVTALAVVAAIALGAWNWQQAERHRLEMRLAHESEERQRFFAGLERVRQRRADPLPGWSRENLADLRDLAELAPAEDRQPDLRSEAASALSALDLVPSGILGADFPAYAVDYSPDGRWLAAAEWKADPVTGVMRVRLYYTGDGTFTSLPLGPDAGYSGWLRRAEREGGFRAVRFSPDGRWLVAGTRDGRLVRWDLDHPDAEPVSWSAHRDDDPVASQSAVRSVGFTADGTLLSGSRRMIRGWTVATGASTGLEARDHQLPLDFHPEADRLPVFWRSPNNPNASRHQYLDLRTGRVEGAGFPGVGDAGVAPGGTLVALATWEANLLQLRPAYPAAGPTFLVAPARTQQRGAATAQYVFDRSGGMLAVVEEHDRRLKVFDVGSGALAAECSLPGDAPRAAFAPGGRRLAVAGGHGVALYDIPNRVLETVAVTAEQEVAGMTATRDHGNVVATTRDPNLESVLYRWHLPSNRPVSVRRLNQGGGPPAADFSPDGKTFVYSVDRGDLLSLDTSDGTRFESPKPFTGRFGPDGRLWLLSEDGTLREATPPRWDCREVWRNDPTSVIGGVVPKSLAVGPECVLVGRRDGRLFRIDAATATAMSWPLCASCVTALDFGPEGDRAVAGSEAGEVWLVDPRTGEATEVADAHRAAVTSLVLRRNLLVTASADRRVRLWTPDGQPIATLTMRGPVTKVLLSSDGRSLLVQVQGERAVRRWRLDLLAREWAALGLSPGIPAR